MRSTLSARTPAGLASGVESPLLKTMTLSAVLNPESDGYVSLCPELVIASQGDTIEEALANLKEALEGFFETASAEEVRLRLKKPALFTRIEVECA
jgi:predicted RNase H-like HicB family nuclease